MELKDIDLGISRLSRQLRLSARITPLNREREKQRFFDALSKGRRYDPVFEYEEVCFDREKEELEQLRSSSAGKGVLGDALRAKIDFLASELEMVSGGDESFTDISAVIYGLPDQRCVEYSRQILSGEKVPGIAAGQETVTPQRMADIIKGEIRKRDLGWDCVLTSRIVPKMTVSGRDRTVYINTALNYVPEEVERLVVHEIETHVFRGINGTYQPYRVFAEGLAGYNETEEGLAILAEFRSGCLEKDTRQMLIYAARALSVAMSLKKGFYEVFAAMREYFPEEIAYRLVERVKRGFKDTSLPGCITRDFHYISGWLKLREYADKGGDMSILYAGKIGIGDVEWVRAAIDEGVLVYPRHLPRWCSGETE